MFIIRKSHFKVAVYIYHHVFISGESQSIIFSLMRKWFGSCRVYIIMFSSMGNSLESWGVYKSSCVDQFHRKSRLKVAVCICHRVFISGESRLKVALCIYHRVFINGESRLKVAVCI